VQFIGVLRIRPRLLSNQIDRRLIELPELLAVFTSRPRRVITACVRRSSSGASSRNA